jgi:cystathionine beta-lyase
MHPASHRTATTWQSAGGGPYIRLHIGLEDPADLIADLERGFERLRAAAGGS